jgi:hypothetical protein
MKTTVDIPDEELKDGIRFTRAKTRQDAIVAAIVDYNRPRRLAKLVKHSGTCEELGSAEENQLQRRIGCSSIAKRQQIVARRECQRGWQGAVTRIPVTLEPL